MTMNQRMLAGSTASMVAELKGMLKEKRNTIKLETEKTVRFTRKGRHKEALENAMKKRIMHEEAEEML
jgi:hypothetical protein